MFHKALDESFQHFCHIFLNKNFSWHLVFSTLVWRDCVIILLDQITIYWLINELSNFTRFSIRHHCIVGIVAIEKTGQGYSQQQYYIVVYNMHL